MASTQQNWDDLGRNIEDVIDRAINSHNYGQLSENVSEVLQKASEAMRQARMNQYNRQKNMVYTVPEEDIRTVPNHTPGQSTRPHDQTGPQEHSYQRYVHQNMNGTRTSSFVYNTTQQQSKTHPSQGYSQGIHQAPSAPAPMVKPDDGSRLIKAFPAFYRSPSGLNAGSICEIVGGGFLTAIGGSNLFYRSIYSLFAHTSILNFRNLFMGMFLAGGIFLITNGVGNLHLIDRYKAYVRALGTNTHCTIEKLSESVARPVRSVKKDLRKLILKGYFLQGHLDAEETSLITSNETFHYYQQSKLQLQERQRQQQEDARKQAQMAADYQATMSSLDPKVREVLDKGEAFIREIHRCNDRIPGHEISQKIDRIEHVVGKIFDRAKEHPEVIPDLKKLMDYYLPMTIKLLNAYADMDSQPIQGETIAASKKEIENTLDTLSSAFEKLLDFIFKDTALDISSDISVLKTLLAQEGLTEDEINTSTRREN